MGYLAEEGIDVEIVNLPKTSSATIVGAGGAHFGISFQPNTVRRKKRSVTAVAAIINNNTVGIMTKSDIKSLKDVKLRKMFYLGG